MIEQVATLTKQVDEKDREILRCKGSIREKDNEIEEMQMQTLDFKSQIIEKDGQIGDLIENLAQKGEEAAAISAQYLEMKNYIIDLQLFETKYQVTRVPMSEIVQSPSV